MPAPPNPPPAQISVPFQHPSVRALAASQRTALAGLAAALFVAAFPLLRTFIDSGDLSQTALKTLALGLAGTLLTAAFVFAQKYLEASKEPVTPVPPSISNWQPPITVGGPLMGSFAEPMFMTGTTEHFLPPAAGTLVAPVALPAMHGVIDGDVLAEVVTGILRQHVAAPPT